MAAAARGPTDHFTWHELGHPPAAHRAAARHLAEHLERLRRIRGGRPLRLISGYRTRTHNAAIGGKPFSQHLQGAAADIPSGYATTAEAERAGFVGIGSRGGWAVHVDVRRGPPARWAY